MKKILLAAVLIGTTLFFAGCGEKKTVGDPTQEPPAAATQNLIDWLKEGELELEYEVETAEGTYIANLAMKDGKLATTQTVDGRTMRIVLQDGKTYVIDDESKTIFTSNTAQTDNFLDTVQELSNEEAVAKGKDTFRDEEYDYEDYEGPDGSKTRFYLQNNSVHYIVSSYQDEVTVMRIITAMTQVDEAAFDLPEDYKQY